MYQQTRPAEPSAPSRTPPGAPAPAKGPLRPAPGRDERRSPTPHRSCRPAPRTAPAPPAELPSTHDALICVALPALTVSTEQGQLTGRGLEGVYRAGRRLLSR